MFAGVGIIGALASILASLLVSPAPADTDEPEAVSTANGDPVDQTSAVDSSPLDPSAVTLATAPSASELAQTRAEMAQTRAQMEELRRQMATMSASLGGAGSAPES